MSLLNPFETFLPFDSFDFDFLTEFFNQFLLKFEVLRSMAAISLKEYMSMASGETPLCLKGGV